MLVSKWMCLQESRVQLIPAISLATLLFVDDGDGDNTNRRRSSTVAEKAFLTLPIVPVVDEVAEAEMLLEGGPMPVTGGPSSMLVILSY
jgi:hypothetical protein